MDSSLTREQALARILLVTRNRLLVFSPEYREALELAEAHNITVPELLAYLRKDAERRS